MTTPVETPFTRIPLFLSETGKRHRVGSYDWGDGVACNDRFLMGRVIEGLVGDVDCEHCLAWRTAPTYDVVTPDKRYKTGYRVVHKAVPEREEAERLANRLIDTLPSKASLPSVQETPDDAP